MAFLAAILAVTLSAAPRAKHAAAERTVTLDVKDAEMRVVLKSVQKQCAIRNLVIDPGVPENKGTFLFRDVPCRTALPVVLRSLGLEAVTDSGALVTVGAARR